VVHATQEEEEEEEEAVASTHSEILNGTNSLPVRPSLAFLANQLNLEVSDCSVAYVGR